MAAPDVSTAVASAETSSDAAHSATVFPPFDAHNFVPQLVWLIVIFGALYWLMSRVALPRVANILEARQARISGDLAGATRMQQQAADASAAYDKKLADAQGRARGLAQETHDKLHAETEAKRHALESDLNARLSAAEQQIAATKSGAMTNVSSIARDAASAIIEHLTGRSASPEAISAAVAAVKPN